MSLHDGEVWERQILRQRCSLYVSSTFMSAAAAIALGTVLALRSSGPALTEPL